MPQEKALVSGIWHGSSDHRRDGACRPAHDCRRHARLRADAERGPGRRGGRDGPRGGGTDRGGCRAAATMAATVLSRRLNWRRAAARSRSSCCASATACRAMRRSAARGWKYPVLPFNPQAIGKPALIIDALFGAGLNRPVKGEPLEMIEAINANGAPVLAVDLPSGINGTTGAVMGIAIAPPRPSRSSGASRRICCCRAGCIAAACASPISGSMRACSRKSAADVREHSAGLAQVLSGAADRRPQICARPCGRRLRRYRVDRRGADGARAARCGPAPGWSRWPRRAMRLPSMPRR